MTDKARELLERALNRWDDCEDISESYLVNSVMEEIRDFLSTPEPTHDEELNKEKALELAHRWCSRYRHGEEFPYWFNEYHLLEFVRRLHPAPEPTQDQEPLYQISLATGRVTSSAWIDVEKDQYDDAGLYPEYARRTLFFHPAPRKPFVRLSEEEIFKLVPRDYMEVIEFARALEDALEEKNK